jgi:hypothetical protein
MYAGVELVMGILVEQGKEEVRGTLLPVPPEYGSSPQPKK